MADLILTRERFPTFRAARTRFRNVPCIYVLTDKEGQVLRIGESDDLWERYKGGTGWMVDAALHGSDKLIFGAEAPIDMKPGVASRRGLSLAANLISAFRINGCRAQMRIL